MSEDLGTWGLRDLGTWGLGDWETGRLGDWETWGDFAQLLRMK
jgi:hypothetical protein